MRFNPVHLVLALAIVPVLAGCVSSAGGGNAQGFLTVRGLATPTPRAVTYCSFHGCQKRTVLDISGRTWNRMRAMVRRTRSPASERRAIAAAMAIFEKAGGPPSGSAADKPMTGFDNRGQLDCIDEASNMTSLLLMLKNAGALRFHRVRAPSYRPPGGQGRWPHYAGTVQERKSGRVYVIDSWFRANGRPAVVVPFATWKTGWFPKSRS